MRLKLELDSLQFEGFVVNISTRTRTILGTLDPLQAYSMQIKATLQKAFALRHSLVLPAQFCNLLNSPTQVSRANCMTR